MSDLGDIGGFLEEGSEYPLLTRNASLDWLDVSEADYKAAEKLPKQNFDVVEPLAQAWAEGRASTLVPVKDYHPAKVMTQPIKIRPEAVAKTARFAMMSGENAVEVLLRTYDKSVLRENRNLLASVLEERGLVGNLYVYAADFEPLPGQYDVALIRKFASQAKFVIGKIACGCGCAGKCQPFTGQKPAQSVEEVLTEKVASMVETEQAAYGKVASVRGGTPKERIRNAYAAQKAVSASLGEVKPTHNPLLMAPKTLPQRRVYLPTINEQREKFAREEAQFGRSEGKVAFEVREFLKRELLKGSSEPEVLANLKVAFSRADLRETRAVWEPLYREAGLFGVVYSTQDAFDSCREGADFLDRHNSPVGAIVSGDRCSTCPSNVMAHCAEYNRPLVTSSEATLTRQAVSKVAKLQAASIGEGDPRSQLKALYRGKKSYNSGYLHTFPKQHIPERSADPLHNSSQPLLKFATDRLASGVYGPELLSEVVAKFGYEKVQLSLSDLTPILHETPMVLTATSQGEEMLNDFGMVQGSFDVELHDRQTRSPLRLDLEGES